MKLKRIVGFLVVAMVVYYIFSDPNGAAATGNNIVATLKGWGDSATQFVARMTA